MKFVLDCSVTMPWLLRNDPTGYAQNILKRLEEDQALVPILWSIEVVNVLLTSERKRKLTEAESERFIYWLNELPIEKQEDEPDMAHVLNLAREHHLSSYDSIYLELAMQKGLRLATLDQPLRAACQRAGVELMI